MSQSTSILAQIRDFFGMGSKEFMQEWKRLPDKDKQDIKQGFADGSMTY